MEADEHAEGQAAAAEAFGDPSAVEAEPEAATEPDDDAEPPASEAGDLDDVPELGLSEDVFADNQQNP
jgi:hypothetical protein